MVPELRAMRLKEIAERVAKRVRRRFKSRAWRSVHRANSPCAQEISQHCRPWRRSHSAFRRNRAGRSRPSNNPHVLVRIQAGRESLNYGRRISERRKCSSLHCRLILMPESVHIALEAPRAAVLQAHQPQVFRLPCRAGLRFLLRPVRRADYQRAARAIQVFNASPPSRIRIASRILPSVARTAISPSHV